MKKMKKLLTRLVLSDILIPTFLVGKKTESYTHIQDDSVTIGGTGNNNPQQQNNNNNKKK